MKSVCFSILFKVFSSSNGSKINQQIDAGPPFFSIFFRASIFDPFLSSFGFLLHPFCPPFGSHLAPFWLPLAPFWLPSDTIWVLFGARWLPLAPFLLFLVTFWFPLLSFSHPWAQFSFFLFNFLIFKFPRIFPVAFYKNYIKSIGNEMVSQFNVFLTICFFSCHVFLHPISKKTRTRPKAPPSKTSFRSHRDLPWTRSGNLPQAT